MPSSPCIGPSAAAATGWSPSGPIFRSSGTDRLQIETDLRRAIERKELSLAYQPVIRLSDGEVAGFEALLRWDHPRKGSIPPSEFIPIAESSDLIEPLGMFALERASSDLIGWQRQTGDLPIFVAVNLSSAQVLNNGLYNDVRPCWQRANATRASSSSS
jgi:EAL domain-containing protein (putative c-di-GMP-specific phosphodiesterase class I)